MINPENKSLFQILGYIRRHENKMLSSMTPEQLVDYIIYQIDEIERDFPNSVEYINDDYDDNNNSDEEEISYFGNMNVLEYMKYIERKRELDERGNTEDTQYEAPVYQDNLLNFIEFKHKDHHTGKTTRPVDNGFTIDTNMVGNIYTLISTTPGSKEFNDILNKFNVPQRQTLEYILYNGYLHGVQFYTTPQIMSEVKKGAEVTKNKRLLEFLNNYCKIIIPKEVAERRKYAEHIAALMTEYSEENIFIKKLGSNAQSAVSSEIKNGKNNYADAKIVSENNLLNGKPLVTLNEKHLVAIPIPKDPKEEQMSKSAPTRKRRKSEDLLNNHIRSEAILKINKRYLQKHRNDLPKKPRAHLKSLKSTTFKVTDLAKLLEM